MNEALINFTEAQKRLGVSRSTLLRWLKTKRITGYKAGKKWKFYPDDLSKVLLKESPAVYIKSNGKELIKSLNPLLPVELQNGNIHSTDFWCEWQDIAQWVMMVLNIKRNYAQIELINNRLDNKVKYLNISNSKANEIKNIWKIWGKDDVNTPSRPGKYRHLSGTNGYQISTLQLPAHIKRATGTFKLSKRIENKIASVKFCDIYFYGPPERRTAFAAYSLLSKLISRERIGTPTVLTLEDEPTYFLPDALQLYDAKPQNIYGTKLCLFQIETTDLMISRGISSPVYRVAYAFGKQNNGLKENKNELIIQL